LTNIENITGSFATTGSNTFFGTQTYSGSVYIANDLIVQGSSSIQYISASSVSIGTNIIQLNTANPSVRYAGLTIIDSGSVGGSGSFLYDSVQDEFIFVHRGNGTNITSSHFVLGPETYDSLGNETYLTTNRLPKGTGKEHLIDSCIFDNGTTVCVNATLKASGQVCGVMSNFSCMAIGTQTPKSTLHLSGENAFNVPLGDILLTRYYDNDSLVAGSSLFHFYNNNDSKEYLAFGVAGSGGTPAKPNQSCQIKMVIGANGNVGINCATPSYNLDVNGCGRFYQPLTNSTSYLIVQNNRSRNAAVYTATTNGGFYAGTSIGTDTFNYQIYDGVAGTPRLTISSTGVTSFSCQICVDGTTLPNDLFALNFLTMGG
jgi:hypothetical protein